MKKLNHWTWIIIGLSVSLAALAYGYFQHWMPNMAEKQAFDEQSEKLDTIIGQRTQAERRVKDALNDVAAVSAEWADIVAVKAPPKGLQNGGIDLSVNPWQLVVDAPRFRDSIQSAVNRQVRHGRVKVISGPQIKPFSQEAQQILATDFNYPALKFPVMFVDLGTITVRGTFNDIIENFEAWSRMPNYMAVSHGLRFTGTSPVLTGTYQVSMVVYIREDQVGAPVPEGAPPANGGGGGGAGGGTLGPSSLGPGGPPIGGGGGGGGKIQRSAASN